MDLNLWKLGNQGLNILFVPKGGLLIQVSFFLTLNFLAWQLELCIAPQESPLG